jgi:hypothetical protein
MLERPGERHTSADPVENSARARQAPITPEPGVLFTIERELPVVAVTTVTPSEPRVTRPFSEPPF